MTFKENLLQKIELERLAARVIASCGTEQGGHRIDKESMRRLLELSPYRYRQERDLILYVKPAGEEQQLILVLDNELPIFRSTIKDVVTRRSPKTLEMWSFRTIRRILVDSDIKVSTRAESVETVLKDAVARLDLTYTDTDIKDLAREGMAWLAGNDAVHVEKILSLFAALLGYRKPPEYFKLDQTVCFGAVAPGQDKKDVVGPLVLYRPAANVLLWIDGSFSPTSQQRLEYLNEVVSGETSVPITGNAVFQKLQANVLERPERVVPV